MVVIKKSVLFYFFSNCIRKVGQKTSHVRGGESPIFGLKVLKLKPENDFKEEERMKASEALEKNLFPQAIYPLFHNE